MKTIRLKKTVFLLCSAWIGAGLTARGADCASFTINAFDQGRYDSSGYHAPPSDDYFCGDGGGPEVRNWFAFNIPALTQTVASASLRIYTFALNSPTGSETYELRHVATPITTLRQGGFALTDIFADLGDGTVYGTRTFHSAEDNRFVPISLDAAFVSNLAAASGRTLALGGRVVHLDGIPANEEYLFGNSGSGGGTNGSGYAQLVVNYSNANPLSIVQEPGSLALLAGEAASFQVRVCGGGAPAYQWQRTGTNLPGATRPFLQLLSVLPADTGLYRVLVTDSVTTVTSAVASLTVAAYAPTGDVYMCSGQSPAPAGSIVRFCSSIYGGPAPTLQWQFNGVNLPGEIYSCLTLFNMHSGQSGSYRIVASNVVGVLLSAPIDLAVNYFAPTGSINLSSGQSPAPAGSSVTLCSAIFGAPYPSLQWQFNGVDLPGQINTCFALSNVSSNQAGLYRLIASNEVGAFTSAPVALTVTFSPPTGTVSLAGGSSPAPAGASVTFCSTISAAPPPAYQWQFNGTNLPGQNGACLYVSDLSSNQAGLYRLVASNVAGVFTSAPLSLDVYYTAPFGSISPSGALPPVLAGTTEVICSTVFGAPAPNLQWQFNGADLLGQNSSCLYLSNPQTNQSGSYRLIASNVSGSFTSAVAVVSIIHAPPAATTYLNGGHTPTTVGGSVTLCSTVSGAPSPTLQWQFNGVNLSGETNGCLYLPNLQTNQSGAYTIVASNALGVVTSAVAEITIIEPVPVLAYFANGVPPLVVGTYIYSFLCAEVSLAEPAALQWRRNGVNVGGATNSCLYVPAQSGYVGEYSVIATTATSGVYTSPPIAFTVYYAPPTMALARSQTSTFLLEGQDASLSASYSGSPSSIQWRFNGVDLPGQNRDSLSLIGVTASQSGNYSFTATNLGGMTTSTVVTQTVAHRAPAFVTQPFDQSMVEGTTASFSASALAGPPPVYFLEHDGTNVAVPFTYPPFCGGCVGRFNLLDTTFADAGSYRIVASNFLGAATSAVVTLTVSSAGPLDRWAQRNPLPQSQLLLSVAHGTNQFVAVGERGTILTSSDGLGWSLQSRRVDVAFNGVAYGGGLFVAVGASGTILSSPDGTNWAYRYTAADTSLNAVAFGDGRFVAVGSAPGASTLVLHSSDGVHWEKIPINGFLAQQCVAYGNGRFIAAGSTSIMVSTGGTHWTLAQSVSRQVESVIFADGQYVAVGDDGSILVSPDAAFWVSRPPVTTRRLLGVAFGAGRFVATGARGNVLTSTNAITWNAVASGTLDRMETIDFAGGRFVAAGENGTIITSTNGTTWLKQNFGLTRNLDGIAVGNGKLVVVGKGGSILTSTDGVDYTTQNAGVTNDLHGVTWGGGLWVAVGEPGIVLTSSDAVNWSSHATGSTNSLKDATYASGQWIVVGTQGTVVRSTDGVNWAAMSTSPAYDLNDVAYGNGFFLVAGDGSGNVNGSLFQSADGVTWAPAAFYPGKNLRGITFANGLFLITANDGVVFTTSDALNFTNSLPFGVSSEGQNFRGATWAHDLWIVTGNNGIIATSTDLTNWTRRATRTFENQHQVALLDGHLVVIGNRGGVLQSGRFVTELATPVFSAGSGFRLPFKGVIGRTYQIEASTDLSSWTSLATFTNTTEHAEFTDPNSGPLALRFYRLVEP